MGGTENLMAALAGASEGASDILKLYAQEKFKRRGNIEDLLAQENMRRRLMQEEQNIWEKRLPMETEQKLRIARETPYLIRNPTTGEMEYTVGGKPWAAPVVKEQPMTPEQKIGFEARKAAAVEEAKTGVKKEANFSRITQATEEVISKYDKAISLANKIKNEIGYTTAIAGRIPWTDSAGTLADMETLKTRLGFNELSRMKQESPTGGALGQVSEKEGEWLQNAEINLSLKQKPEKIKQNLDKLISGYERSKSNVMKAYEKDYNRKISIGTNLPILNQQNESSATNGLPNVGDVFQGGKVLRIRKIQ